MYGCGCGGGYGDAAPATGPAPQTLFVIGALALGAVLLLGTAEDPARVRRNPRGGRRRSKR